MAGIQQAINSAVSAPGRIAQNIGIYNELVGKNQALIHQLGEEKEKSDIAGKKAASAAEALADANEKSEKLTADYESLNAQYQDLVAEYEKRSKGQQSLNNKSFGQKKRRARERTQALAERAAANKSSQLSKSAMVDLLAAQDYYYYGGK